MVEKYVLDWDLELTEDISQLIGAFIGDGCCSIYGYMIQFTGDAQLDKDYLESFIANTLLQFCSDFNPAIRTINNVMRVTIYSKQLFDLFTEVFKFSPGLKSHFVVIPEIILNSEENIIMSCLRGIFDTDGSLYFDQRPVYSRPYPRIELHMRSKNLLKQVHYLLNYYGVPANINTHFSKVQINGFVACKKFYEIIGFGNNRHISKIKTIMK